MMKYKHNCVSDLLRSALPGLKVGYSTNASATPNFFIRGDNTIKASGSAERSANAPPIVVEGVILILDLRPIYHKNDDATIAHLHLGLLAYWLVNTIKCKLKAHWITLTGKK